MTMRPRLHSISSLSVETGRDRRTVARILGHTPPDGKLPGGHDAWLMTTFLDAMAERRTANGWPISVSGESMGPGGNDRIRAWLKRIKNFDHNIIEVEAPVTLQEFADAHFIDAETVLMWVRMGLPIASAGSLDDGTGITLDAATAREWIDLAQHFTINYGTDAEFRRLGFEGWEY